MMDWFGISGFAPGPIYGSLCLAILLTIPLTWRRYLVRKNHPTLRFSDVDLLQDLPRTLRQRLWFVTPLFRSLAIAALVFALARPQSFGFARHTAKGIAIEMVLDVSGSMAEQDFVIDGRAARRIDAVKQVFRDFVLGTDGLSGRRGDLIGMVSFAMFADVTCPLTLDHGNLEDLLRETEIPGFVRGVQRYEHPESNYTALGDAVMLGTDQLRQIEDKARQGIGAEQAARSRVLIVLSDGANHPAPHLASLSPDPVEAARLAGKLGIKIYTIGAVGNRAQSGRRSMFSQVFRGGNSVDERVLRAMATAGNGKYFRATDTASLRSIYEEIDELEKLEVGEQIYDDDTTSARWAVVLGMVLLALEMMVSHSILRRLP